MNVFSFFRKYKQNIFVFTVVGFIAGIFLGFGVYIGYKPIQDTAAVVNGKKIPFKNYEKYYKQLLESVRQQNQEITDETTKNLKQQVLRDLVQEEVFWQEAKKYGIVVSDKEVFFDIMRIPAFQKDGKFDRETYLRTLFYRLQITPKEFETSRRKRIARAKLTELLLSPIKLTPQEFGEALKLKNINPKELEKNKDKYYQEILQEKQNAVLEEWYKQINNNVKIKVLIKDI